MAFDDDLNQFARDAGLLQQGESAEWTVLSGGVSCDIWLVTTPSRRFVVKRALAQLRVAAEWRAPVERNATEWAWFETAGRILPDAVPGLLAHDEARGLFAMEYLPPEDHRLWKAELLAGRVDVDFARAVGSALGRIHAATAGDAAIARRFATDKAFFDLRLDAYLLATGRAHPALLPRFEALAERTGAIHVALVHGDVSPKNILMGPRGPVFLDAETAWYGDPAFDLAFCLNHLLLKALVVPQAAADLQASFDALFAAWAALAEWEPHQGLEARVASLLPAMMLARVDGKSPVEYLDAARRDVVRRFALPRVAEAPASLTGFYAAWRAALGDESAA